MWVSLSKMSRPLPAYYVTVIPFVSAKWLNQSNEDTNDNTLSVSGFICVPEHSFNTTLPTSPRVQTPCLVLRVVDMMLRAPILVALEKKPLMWEPQIVLL